MCLRDFVRACMCICVFECIYVWVVTCMYVYVFACMYVGYTTHVVALIVGSLGHVHKRFRSGLRKVGIPSYEAKFLANFCSISAITYSSHKVWKMRCRAMNV